ncbi:MAG TPA: hypothetical protein VLA89_06125 [Gemmatimonadales bacterium]|nr:hypothetical protein [Gemmatimonadales bacterium]
MPLYVEHLRRDAKSHPENPVWEQVEHRWDLSMTLTMSHLIEEDGGPEMAYGSGYGIFHGRPEVDHTFTLNYSLPDGAGIKKGDRIRMWRGA